MIYKPDPEPTPVPEPEPKWGEEDQAPLLRVGAAEYSLERGRLLIGRSRDCDIRLTDPNVSRRHSEVRKDGAGYVVVDLDSTNGTEVNGRRAKRARLEDGDVIVLGSTELVFELPRT
jgi:pSer/pThr/pTyr-binding forkhead associated (FHA) protein